jgi:site-specific recombinase XerD
MEPDAVQDQMRQAVNWMIQQAPTMRDQIVLQLLRTTGARLSEILALTVGGYRQAGHVCQALIRNKGSQGREEKRLYFTAGIEQALIMYIRTERAKHDPLGRKRLGQLADTDPLFLTERGTPYTRPAFYHHWYRLLERMQKRYHLAFSPHDLRHLHVTKNLARFKQQAKGNDQLEDELKAGFQQLMMWRSSAMLEVYNKVRKKRLALLEMMMEEDEQPLARIANLEGAQPSRQIPPKPSVSQSPSIARAEDHDLRWYEEE